MVVCGPFRSDILESQRRWMRAKHCIEKGNSVENTSVLCEGGHTLQGVLQKSENETTRVDTWPSQDPGRSLLT